MATLAREALGAGQKGPKWQCYKKVQVQEYSPSVGPSLFAYIAYNKLQVKWQGPYKVKRRVGEVDFEVAIPHKGFKLFHVNLLNACTPR